MVQPSLLTVSPLRQEITSVETKRGRYKTRSICFSLGALPIRRDLPALLILVAWREETAAARHLGVEGIAQVYRVSSNVILEIFVLTVDLGHWAALEGGRGQRPL